MIASLICVYNNSSVVNNQLLKSIENQIDDIELIMIDNTKGSYTSAAEALDYGVSKSTTDVVVFIHQDVFIKESDGLRKFIGYIADGKEGDIFGVAGAIEKKKKNLGLFTSGDVYCGKLLSYEWTIMKVSCLDECMFGMKKATYKIHPFNTVLCDDWHLYCVEMCLYARKNGSNVWLVPIQIHHFSGGVITTQYMSCLRKLVNRYNKDFKYIWTTAYKVRCNKIYIDILVIAWKLNRSIRSFLRNYQIDKFM